MNVEGNRCTEDIDNVPLQMRVSPAKKIFFQIL